MQKIPTIFKRDPENMSRVLPEWNPDCFWVRDGEGVPTRKYDGTCVMMDEKGWWARREVKPGKDAPSDFRMVEYDNNTGKSIGWEPIQQSPFYKFWAEAIENWSSLLGCESGTYELIGPKINGNPEGMNHHYLVAHSSATKLPFNARTFEAIKEWVCVLWEGNHVEGVVFHHPDGRMAKIKARDFK